MHNYKKYSKKHKKYRKAPKPKQYTSISLFSKGILCFIVVTAGFLYLNKFKEHFLYKDLVDSLVILTMGLSVANFLFCFTKKQAKRWKYLNSGFSKIDKMSGVEFEEYLKYNFEKLGYKVSTTRVSNDYGCDLVLKKHNTRICVQAKRYSSSVGNKAVQEVVAAMAVYKCSKGIVVTNSYFTSNAKVLAKANKIDLWDRQTLIKKFKVKK